MTETIRKLVSACTYRDKLRDASSVSRRESMLPEFGVESPYKHELLILNHDHSDDKVYVSLLNINILSSVLYYYGRIIFHVYYRVRLVTTTFLKQTW